MCWYGWFEYAAACSFAYDNKPTKTGHLSEVNSIITVIALGGREAGSNYSEEAERGKQCQHCHLQKLKALTSHWLIGNKLRYLSLPKHQESRQQLPSSLLICHLLAFPSISNHPPSPMPCVQRGNSSPHRAWRVFFFPHHLSDPAVMARICDY